MIGFWHDSLWPLGCTRSCMAGWKEDNFLVRHSQVSAANLQLRATFTGLFDIG